MQSTPHLLVNEALQAIALQGHVGVRVDALWPLLPRVGADAAARSFLWKHLCSHTQVSVSLGGRTVEQVRALALLDASDVLLKASNSLRAWVYGTRDGCDECMTPNADMTKVLEELARHGSRGVLQNQLTKDVGIPANKLSYTLSQLEIDHVMKREAVWLNMVNARAVGEAGGSSSGAGGSSSTDPAPAAAGGDSSASPGFRGIFNKAVNPVMKTNLVALGMISVRRLPFHSFSSERLARASSSHSCSCTG